MEKMDVDDADPPGPSDSPATPPVSDVFDPNILFGYDGMIRYKENVAQMNYTDGMLGLLALKLDPRVKSPDERKNCDAVMVNAYMEGTTAVEKFCKRYREEFIGHATKIFVRNCEMGPQQGRASVLMMAYVEEAQKDKMLVETPPPGSRCEFTGKPATVFITTYKPAKKCPRYKYNTLCDEVYQFVIAIRVIFSFKLIMTQTVESYVDRVAFLKGKEDAAELGLRFKTVASAPEFQAEITKTVERLINAFKIAHRFIIDNSPK